MQGRVRMCDVCLEWRYVIRWIIGSCDRVEDRSESVRDYYCPSIMEAM